ncbi:hypothetical protein ACU5B6_08585 [Moritella viscosa]|uniref:hypothetical protein n=1 Tax=Moritella viscosa TaxID=80854 RepID=UPI000920FCCD|nr:hypothetical protein [Moritella viscosa]SHO03239.1 Putative uncharacterized protein [Moritella viscosa]SHO15871.1 Putative uncharacterized protein [Moritella viscosa]SHO19234.1 Putative uncharacterized protein [Moritella viscosa]
MKRISVPIEEMISALQDFGVSDERANDIAALFEVVDAGDYDALVMPALAFNHSQLPRKTVLITLSSFWVCVVGNTNSFSEQELQALDALRSLYFVAVNLGYQGVADCIAQYWERTHPLHFSKSVELWR